MKIRYAELPAGLHVKVVARGRRTIIYLLPGLTVAQRRAALTRVKASGRIGLGPRLPALGLAVGIGADRIRRAARTSAAATRRHPALLLPPLVLVASAATAVVLTSVATLAAHGSPPPGATLQQGMAMPGQPAGVAGQNGIAKWTPASDYHSHRSRHRATLSHRKRDPVTSASALRPKLGNGHSLGWWRLVWRSAASACEKFWLLGRCVKT